MSWPVGHPTNLLEYANVQKRKKKPIDKSRVVMIVLLVVLCGGGFFVLDSLEFSREAGQQRGLDWIGGFISSGIFVGFLALLFIGAHIAEKRRWKAEREKYDLEIDALRRTPAKLEPLRGQFQKVCVMRSSGIEREEPLYLSFVIDHKGETCDVEESTDHDEIAARARWLAQALELPFHDASYGG